MKTRTLLLTTFLSTAVLMGGFSPARATDSITTDTINTARSPVSTAEMTDPRVAASSFVEHVNFARVALAMKNVPMAQQHIAQAKTMIALVKNATAEQRLISKLEYGRIVYQYDTQYKYHYFPIEAGPVEVKQMASGPVWAVNDLAVTDADIVYLTLDLRNDGADVFLQDAEKAIANGNLREADKQLAMLTDAVINVDTQLSVPALKARDNIALARNFISGKNYDGARYALSHADDALAEMEGADVYKTKRTDIRLMRNDVRELQEYIVKKNPDMIEKTNIKISKWWMDMKTWTVTE